MFWGIIVIIILIAIWVYYLDNAVMLNKSDDENIENLILLKKLFKDSNNVYMQVSPIPIDYGENFNRSCHENSRFIYVYFYFYNDISFFLNNHKNISLDYSMTKEEKEKLYEEYFHGIFGIDYGELSTAFSLLFNRKNINDIIYDIDPNNIINQRCYKYQISYGLSVNNCDSNNPKNIKIKEKIIKEINIY